MSDILNVNSAVLSDESITGIQFHSYSPYTTTFNSNDEIRIAVQHQDIYTLPSESYIYIQGSIARRAAGADATPNLADFAPAHMFADIRYEINGFEVDRCKTPGITGLMKGFSSHSPSDKCVLTTSGFKADAPWAQEVVASFEYRIPLKMLLGFAEDYKKIIMHAKQELILVRSRSDVKCFIGANDNVVIRLTKIQWKIPHVNVSDQSKLRLLKTIERREPIAMAFRSWDLYEYPALPQTDKHMWSIKTTNDLNKPRYVIVAFQTGRQAIAHDASKFDHCNISDLKVHLNSESYPYENLNLNFETNLYMQAFINYATFKKSYYYEQADYENTMADYAGFKASMPMFVIDCSRQNESIKASMVDISLEITARANFPANTTAYCLIIHDNIITYNPYTNAMARAV